MSVGRLKRMLDCLPTGCYDPNDKETPMNVRSEMVVAESQTADGDVRQYINDYRKFNTLIELDESTQSTVDDNTESSAVNVPLSQAMVAFNQFIEQEHIGDRVKWGRMVMQFIFSIGNSEEQPGKLTFGFKREAIFLANAEQLRNPYFLSAHVIAHDTEAMPVDIIFSFKTGAGEGGKPAVAPGLDAQAGDHSSPSSSSSYTNGAMLLRSATRAVYQVPPTLFGNVLVFEDPLRRVRFSSIEAVNFNSEDFLNRIARRVDRSDEVSVARLFCISNQQRLAQRNVTACSRHGTNKHCFYLVSLEYMFTSLLRRVHDYLVICQAQSDYLNSPPLDALDCDSSLYKLPVTSVDVVFECDALSRVLQFINSHLVGAHPPFAPEKICANIRPFASLKRDKVDNNWTSVWNAHLNSAAAAATVRGETANPESVAVPERNLECCVTCVFNFVSLPEQITSLAVSTPVIPVRPERPRRRPPVLSKRNDSTTDDEKGVVANGDNESTSSTENHSPVLQEKTRHSVPNMPALVRRSGKHEKNDTPPDSMVDARKLPGTTDTPRLNHAVDNNDDDGDGDDGDYDFLFGKYLTTPRRHTMPPATSPSMLEEQKPSSTSPAPGTCGAADGAQSHRTPRTESPSEQAANKMLQSVTTGSRDGSESNDDDDGDGDDDEEDDAEESEFDLAPVPEPTPRPTVGAFGTPIPTSNTPYTPIRHHIRSPPPAPPIVAARSLAKSTYNSVESRSAGSEQATQFHLSSSSGTQSTTIDDSPVELK